MRAERLHSFGDNLFAAQNAYVTTCEFGLPHYRIGADRVTVAPVTDADGSQSAIVTAEDVRIKAGNATVLWWPRISRDIRDTHIPLRRLQAGSSGRFGTYVYSNWDLLDIIAGKSPESWAARASRNNDVEALLDYRSRRGGAGGATWAYDYENIKGDFLGYYTRDNGKDATGFIPPDDRGRVWWQQRAFSGDWQIDSELSYISDRGFLTEYFEREAKEGKEQETYLYAKRPWEHVQADLLYRVRLNDFQTQVEYMPQARVDAAGYPLLGDHVVYTSTTRADNARFRPDEMLALPSYQTQRVDTYHNFDLPLHTDWGLSFAPFTSVRGSYFEDDAGGAAVGRFAGSVGAHAGLPPVWRVYDVYNKTLGINRVRHVATLDFTYEDVYDSTREPTELLQFDDIDAVRTMQVATVRLRNRLQTKRLPIEEGAPMRTVDLATVDVEADYFPEAQRDNAGRQWSTSAASGDSTSPTTSPSRPPATTTATRAVSTRPACGFASITLPARRGR